MYNAIISIDTGGLTGINSGSVMGTVVVSTPSTLPHGYDSDTVTSATGVLSYTYVIEGLQPGVGYYVAVSSLNAGGYSTAQQSLPQQLAPPEQKPSEPMEVYMVSQSSSFLYCHYYYNCVHYQYINYCFTVTIISIIVSIIIMIIITPVIFM